MTQEIKEAAESLAAAKLAAESGMTALTAASAEVDKVRARIADLDSERAQIVAERKAGRISKGHGPRLAEIEADQDGLREILAETSAAYGVAGAEFQGLQRSVTAAEYSLALASDQAMLSDLKALASDLDQRLLGTIGEISIVAKRLGQNRSQWFPTVALATGIRRLDIEQGAMAR